MTRAIVVGSGPNGLAAALTLAAQGVDVRVIEASDTLGGGTRSSELTVPGVLHDECSGFHPFALSSEFAEHFELAAAGLTYCWAPAEFSHPLEDGRGAVAHRSLTDTASELGRRDGRVWTRVFGPIVARFPNLAPEILQPVLHIPKSPWLLTRFGLRSLLPASWLARCFESPEARALFGGVAAHAFRPLTQLFSSAIGVTLTAAAHAYGWPVARGGSRTITEAVLKRAVQYNVAFETGRRVTHLEELQPCDLVMLDTSPRAAVEILGERLPPAVRSAYQAYRHGPGAFKVDFAIEDGVPWAHEDSTRAGTVHLGGTFEELAAAERAVCEGRMPERPFVLVGQQYLADPTRSAGRVHPLYAYAHVPSGYTADATQAIIARIEQFAPGFQQRIVGMAVRTTTDLSVYNPNYVGGDIVTGANDPWQLMFRPRLTLDPYATGVAGVYLCSAATPPGAGAHGMCGYHAARNALAWLARR